MRNACRRIEPKPSGVNYQAKILKFDRKTRTHKKTRNIKIARLKEFAKTVIVTFCIMGTFGSVIYNHSIINEQKYKIYSLKEEIRNNEILKEEISLKIESEIVLENIEKRAIQELGMQYPDPGQIKRIDSLKTYTLEAESINSVVSNSQLIQTEEQSAESSVLNFIDEIVSTIYPDSEN